MRLVASLISLVLVSSACGGPNAQAMRAAADAKTMSDEERGDSICGAGWKWTGDRCARSDAPVASKPTTAGNVNDPPAPTRSGNFAVEDTVPGNGAQAKPGDQVRVHYTGALTDGTVFDSSKPRGTPFEFRIGQGMVIKGFERGVVGMKVGGVRKVTIPPELGYGKRGAPPQIPPNATLIFDIELLDVKP
jgi:FKBP-type peptidyl-prolyl cis-trans isomerase FkpA